MRDPERPWPKWVCACALFLGALSAVAILYSCFERPYRSDQAVLLWDGWSYQTSEGPERKPVEDLRQYIRLRPDETVILRRIMREDIENGVLDFISAYQRIKIYLDDGLIFDNQADITGRNPGRAAYSLPLPDGYTGKELRVEGSSPYKLYAYSPSPPRLGDINSLQAYRIGYAARNVVIAILLTASGILFILFSLLMTMKDPKIAQWGNYSFGVFCILFGFMMLGEKDIWALAVPPAAAGALDMLFWLAFPLPLLLCFLSQCEYTKAPIRMVLAFYSICTAAALLLVFAGMWDLPDSLVLLNPAYILITVAMGILSGVEWVKRNSVIRYLSPGMGLLVLSAIFSAVDIHAFFPVKEILRIAGLLALAAFMWVYQLRVYAARRRDEQRYAQMLSAKHGFAMESLESANRYIRESGALRHEANHHLTALKILSDEGDMDGIARYLEKLVASADGWDPALQCENVLVNAILRKYAADCRIDGIKLICSASVPKDLPFAQDDLCTLLMNLMDNALEACRKLRPQERWIRVQVRKKGNFLVISCENAWDGDMPDPLNGLHGTTKPEPALHGFGLHIMREVAEKYESTLNIQYDESAYNVKTALRFPK